MSDYPFFWRVTIYYRDSVQDGTLRSRRELPVEHAMYLFSARSNMHDELNTPEGIGSLVYGSAASIEHRTLDSIHVEEMHFNDDWSFDAYPTELDIDFDKLLQQYVEEYLPKQQKAERKKKMAEFKAKNGGGMVNRGGTFTAPSQRRVT